MSIPLDDICRACMSVGSMMGSIFDEFIPGVTLADRMMAISSVMIDEGDGLPKFICYNCAQKVNLSYEFKKVCENSDAGLREYLKEQLEKKKLARIGQPKPRVQPVIIEGKINECDTPHDENECDSGQIIEMNECNRSQDNNQQQENQCESISSSQDHENISLNIIEEEEKTKVNFKNQEIKKTRGAKSKKSSQNSSPLKKRCLIMQPLKTKLKDERCKKKSLLNDRLSVKTNTYMGCEPCGTSSIINKLPDIVNNPKTCRDCNQSVDFKSHLIIHVNECSRLCYLQCVKCYYSLGSSCEKSRPKVKV